METSKLLEVIRYRRSVRDYDPRPIEAWKLATILESARIAPSSTNSQPWRIVVVNDPALKAEIASSTPGHIAAHPWMANANIILVLCAVKSRVQKIAQLLGKNYHLVDMGIVGEHMVLIAAELGLGTCWVGWFHKTRVKQILTLPASWEAVCLLPIGYPKGSSAAASQPEAQHATTGPIQQEGEPGIGNVAAKARRLLDETVFINKMEKLKENNDVFH
jgi:nitroreductase